MSAEQIFSIFKIFYYLFFGSIALLVIGIIKPNLVIRWGKEENRTRIKAALICGGIVVSLFIITTLVDKAYINALHLEDAAKEKAKQQLAASQPVQAPAQPVAQAPAPKQQKATPVKKEPKLAIMDGWTWNPEGKYYTKIIGKVKNVGDIDVGFFKVTAEYLDRNGNVIDTKEAADMATIRPGNQKQFEIIRENDENIAKVRLVLEEVDAK